MKTTLSQVFGENVRKHRERCGYTQEQLAEHLGVEIRTLSRIECGDQGSKFATIEKISEVLKIEAWRLFDQKNDSHECDIETLEIYNDEISLRVASVIKVNEGKEYTVFTRNAKTRFERNRNQVKDESAPLRIQALSSTFRILLEKYPSTDPGVLWGNLQNAHVEIMRRVGKNQTSANQSWVKSSGTAFEVFVQKMNKPPFQILKPIEFKKLSMIFKVKNSDKLIGRSEDDMMVVYESNNCFHLTGVIQAKTSIRDRMKMDMTHSQHMLNANLWSAFITIDPDGFLNKPKFKDLANGDSDDGVVWHGVYAFSDTVAHGSRLHGADKFIPHLIDASESVIRGEMNPMWTPQSILQINN